MGAGEDVGADFAADAGEDVGKDFDADAGEDFDADAGEDVGKDFDADAGEDFVADGGRDVDGDTGGSRSLHLSGAGGRRSFHESGMCGAGKSRYSLSLTRRGLNAPDAGGEDRSRCTLSLSLTRRGLDAPGAGGEDVEADADGNVGGGFGAGVGADSGGDFRADRGEDAGAPSEGFCGVIGMSKNVTSQSGRKTLIFYTPEFRPERKRASILARSCPLSGRGRLGARSPAFASIFQ